MQQSLRSLFAFLALLGLNDGLDLRRWKESCQELVALSSLGLLRRSCCSSSVSCLLNLLQHGGLERVLSLVALRVARLLRLRVLLHGLRACRLLGRLLFCAQEARLAFASVLNQHPRFCPRLRLRHLCRLRCLRRRLAGRVARVRRVVGACAERCEVRLAQLFCLRRTPRLRALPRTLQAAERLLVGGIPCEVDVSARDNAQLPCGQRRM
mmetsp:Transcript_7807/g.17235  ORF Transcript_7807/g.17235 Transcript_7807/m.17235 type:complete len:210 (-) Transcript_7807:696-1325(-)